MPRRKVDSCRSQYVFPSYRKRNLLLAFIHNRPLPKVANSCDYQHTQHPRQKVADRIYKRPAFSLGSPGGDTIGSK